MTMQAFSIVIPTYKEAKNIEHLAKAVQQTSFAGREFEVILMDDDSNDGSLDIVRQLQTTYPWLRMIVRQGKRSLSLAVIEGCQQAKHPLIVSMDADLSHPTTSIPAMLTLLENDQADLVIGSRYIPGGSVDPQWSWQRRAISRACALLAKSILLLKINDPLSGFFAIKKSTFMRGNIVNPSGWKIALEIMIKCRCEKTAEVPIHFSDRRYGKSKLNARVSMAFLKQLGQLAFFQYLK